MQVSRGYYHQVFFFTFTHIILYVDVSASENEVLYYLFLTINACISACYEGPKEIVQDLEAQTST
jgi:hypothetical protein